MGSLRDAVAKIVDRCRATVSDTYPRYMRCGYYRQIWARSDRIEEGRSGRVSRAAFDRILDIASAFLRRAIEVRLEGKSDGLSRPDERARRRMGRRPVADVQFTDDALISN